MLRMLSETDEKSVNIYIIDPILDNRWDELVAHHPRASVFHRRGWLEALARTRGRRRVVGWWLRGVARAPSAARTASLHAGGTSSAEPERQL